MTKVNSCRVWPSHSLLTFSLHDRRVVLRCWNDRFAVVTERGSSLSSISLHPSERAARRALWSQLQSWLDWSDRTRSCFQLVASSGSEGLSVKRLQHAGFHGASVGCLAAAGVVAVEVGEEEIWFSLTERGTVLWSLATEHEVAS